MKLQLTLVMAAVMVFAAFTAGNVAAQTEAPPAPTGITAANGDEPGEVIVSWNAVDEAAFFRIGWVAKPDYEATVAADRDWLEAFHFLDAANSNLTEWTLTRLSPGVEYWFIVASNDNRNGVPQYGDWSNLLALTPAPPIDYSDQYPNCDAVRAHHPGGVKRGSPIYRTALDRDGDGFACEQAATPAPQPPTTTGDGMMTPILDSIINSSTSASATVELRLTIDSLPMNAVAGSAVELYLEDNFQVPDSISTSSIYFVADNPTTPSTGNGGRVLATAGSIHDGDHFGGRDDWAIRIFIPDMRPGGGYDGPRAGQTLTMVITKSAGIKNPSEEGTHSVGYSVLGPNDRANAGPQVQLGTVATYAKISLSDEDNKRGYELTVTGSGFNNGTTAGAYVLHIDGGDGSNAALWDALNCPEMDMAVGAEAAAAGDYCQLYANLGAMEKEVVGGLDFSSGYAEAALCSAIIRSGAQIGGAVVGSDDKVAVTAEVTVPTFQAGNNNYICMVDGEGRTSSTDVEQFYLEASIRAVPSVASAGDTVTVFAQDFPVVGAPLMRITMGGRPVNVISTTSIGRNYAAEAIFTVPSGLTGIVTLAAQWGEITESTRMRIN